MSPEQREDIIIYSARISNELLKKGGSAPEWNDFHKKVDAILKQHGWYWGTLIATELDPFRVLGVGLGAKNGGIIQRVNVHHSLPRNRVEYTILTSKDLDYAEVIDKTFSNISDDEIMNEVWIYLNQLWNVLVDSQIVTDTYGSTKNLLSDT